MKRYLAIFALVILAGCANQTPESVVFSMRTAYVGTVLAPAARYAQLPTCTVPRTTTVVCKEATAVAALQKADAAAKASLDAAEDVVRNNPQVDASFAIAAARNAVSAATTIITIYGIR